MVQAGQEIGGPIDPSRRVGSIDSLRGIALFGVLAINLETAFRVSIFQQFVPTVPERGLDALIGTALFLLVDMKAFALFSLLFGVGLAIQFERLAGTGRRTRLLVRRMLVLLLFGLVHLVLIWNGDILTEYALAGLVVLPFLFGPNWLIATASAALLAIYVLQPSLPSLVAFPDQATLAARVRQSNDIYPTGTFAEVLALRIGELRAFLPLHTYVFPRTLGLFLLGILIWRAGLFDGRKPSSPWLWFTAASTIAAGLILAEVKPARPHSDLASPIVLALGYATLVMGVARSATGRRWLAWVEPLGRMAFTNYLMQSVVLGFVFYGYGLGYFDRLGLTTGMIMVIAIYLTQVGLSRAWLARFRYGPIEWLWRALYGRAPQFRRASLAQGLQLTN